MKDFIILFLIVFSSLSIYLLGKFQDKLRLNQIIVYLQSTAIRRFLDYRFAASNFDKERLKGIRKTLHEATHDTKVNRTLWDYSFSKEK